MVRNFAGAILFIVTLSSGTGATPPMGLVIHASMAKVLLFTPGKTTGGVLPEGIFSLLCEKQCMLQHNALSANIALGDLTSGKRNSFKFKAIIFKKSIYLTQQIFKRM